MRLGSRLTSHTAMPIGMARRAMHAQKHVGERHGISCLHETRGRSSLTTSRSSSKSSF